MKCPNCGLFHPSRYEQCVSCGSRLTGQEAPPAPPAAPPRRPPPDRSRPGGAAEGRSTQATKQRDEQFFEEGEEEDEEDEIPARSNRRRQLGLVLTVCGGIILACAGGTYFFLTRPPEYERLLNEGKQQLQNGQYAFAQKTLEQAAAIKPNDPRILLSLARAYVGIDQVEKAWQFISQAQQQGQGVMTDTQLSSDLANYYRQRHQFKRAAELLRPLAQQDLPKKRAELSDLLALWGDETFRKGNSLEAMKCWEEVKELKDGARFQEADSRLASIYQKLATEALSKTDDETALEYYNKLNYLAPSQQTFEKTSEICARLGKVDLAIDQLKRAIKSGTGSHDLNRKLADLLSRRGRELLDGGDADSGYAYLQQAQGLDPKVRVPTVALRRMSMNLDPSTGTLYATGDIWNPGPRAVNYLALRGELCDKKSGEVLWRREQHIVDEFVPPMSAHETKQFTLAGSCPARQDGSIELKIYLDGTYYATYPVKPLEGSSATAQAARAMPPVGSAAGRDTSPVPGLGIANPAPSNPAASLSAPVQPRATDTFTPRRAMDPMPAPDVGDQAPAVSPEEKTLRDLD